MIRYLAAAAGLAMSISLWLCCAAAGREDDRMGLPRG